MITIQKMTDITDMTKTEVAELLNVDTDNNATITTCLSCNHKKVLNGSFCETCTDNLSCIKRLEKDDPYNKPFSVNGLVKNTDRTHDEAFEFMKAYDKL